MKYKLKLVRPDIDSEDMVSFSESNVTTHPTISRSTKKNMRSSVQVKFNERWIAKTQDDVDAESEGDCTPVGNVPYARSGTDGFQVHPLSGWTTVLPGLTGDASIGYTVVLSIPVLDDHLDYYGGYNTDSVSVRINTASDYALTFSSAKGSSSVSRETLLSAEGVKFWDFRNPTSPCVETWTTERYGDDRYSYLRTETFNANFARNSSIGLSFHIESSNFAFMHPFSMYVGNAFHPDWFLSIVGTTSFQRHWSLADRLAYKVNPRGYKIYLGAPI
jgi:hypothetical protein